MQRELVERAQRGDDRAFAALVRPTADRLYAVAYRILRDADRAEDATQGALIEAWQHLRQLRDPNRFEAWTYRMVIRAAYREARTDRRLGDAVRSITIRPSASPDPADTVADRDELEIGFRRLSPEHRAVLVLHYYLGLPAGEIAEILGVSVGTVGSRLHYAARSMRAALEADARSVLATGRAV